MYNRAILLGRVGVIHDDAFKEAGTTHVFKFSLATNSRKLDKNTNNYEDETTWHNIVAWGKTAEFCKNYVNSGDLLNIEGTIKQNKYESKDGEKTYHYISVLYLNKVSSNSNANKNETKQKVEQDDIPF